MKYKKLDKSLYIDNRKRFTEHLESGALAIFNSNDIFGTSADSSLPFVQHRDIFHLSGVDQEESILLVFPDSSNKNHREILFLKETSPLIAVWEGAKLDKKEAYEVSGIKTVYWLDQFETIFNALVLESSCVYLNTNEHTRANTEAQTREDRFISWFKEKYPASNTNRSAPIMHKIRSIKHSLELEQMQKACDITERGMRRLLDFVKPGVMEYNIEAELMHEFLNSCSRGFAYTPIIASGNSACVLHYVENNNICKDGEVILMDFGAEYGGYASDLSRSIPVNGKFTQRQKDVYNSVLYVKNEACKLLIPGKMLNEYHLEVGELMQEQLVKLNLMSLDDIKNQDESWPAYKKYFMHGTSHFIGLDTHDVGLWTKPIEENMVFTIEPGIYIPEENLGIRLEDDYVIQNNGQSINLMKNIPIEVEEIEELMNN